MTATTSTRPRRHTSTRPALAPRRAGAAGFAGSLIRPDDQVRLTFELVNGTVDPATNQILALEPDDHVFYLVSFGSQHTTEDTISINEVPPDEPLGHRRALPSRVCVEIPAGTEFTVGNLLDLAGYLAPFGHRASLTTLSERVLRSDESGDLTASLTADTYLAIGSPTVTYPADTSIFMPHERRQLPFTAVVAEDNGRGPVDREHIVMTNGSRLNLDKACLLTRAGIDLQIFYTATDRAGQDGITFELPAVFVADTEDGYEANDSVGGSGSGCRHRGCLHRCRRVDAMNVEV